MSWLGGTLPYTIVTALNATFDNGVKTVATGVTATTATVTVNAAGVLNCFDVSDASTLTEAAQGMGYTPYPAPTLPAPSVQSAWWGDSVHFAANNLDPIAQANSAFFFDLPARGTQTDGGSPPSWVQFTIPDDARLSFPVVQAHGRSSGLNVATPVFLCPPGLGPNPDGTFNNIRGVVWDPPSGKVWVASDNLVQQNDIFLEKPQKGYQISTYGKPYISRVTTQVTSGGNFFLVIDGNNPNYIYKVDPSTGVAAPIPFASTVDSGFLRDIVPVGIAVDPDGLVCYIADASAGKVVMIPAGAGVGTSTIKDNWGNRTFTFPDPCGIDVNVGDVNIGHQVIVADDSTGYTYQITGPSTSRPDWQLGTGIHSIQIDQDSSTSSHICYGWSNNLSHTEAFNLNPVVPGDDTSKRYHSAHIFAMDDGHLDVDQNQAILATMRGFVRVVINNSGLTQAYPSPSVQVTDRIVKVGLIGWQGVPMHLRVIDPPDLAAYFAGAPWLPGAVLPYEGNDNEGTDFGLATSPNASSWTPTLDVIPANADGSITVYLKVAARYSGDNYQIEITKCKADGTILPQRVAGLSGVYTSWKRVFVERDKMFRNGGLLYADYIAPPPGCGQLCPCGGQGQPACNQIEVYDWSSTDIWQAPIGDTIVVFDETHTREAGGEERFVTFVAPGSIPGKTLYLTLKNPLVDDPLMDPLANNYQASAHDKTPMPTFYDSDHQVLSHSGGYGVTSGCVDSDAQINAGSCYFDPDMRDFEQPFDDAYIEVLGQRSGMGAIPLLPESWFATMMLAPGGPLPGPAYFSQIWFKNFVPAGGSAPQYNAPHNYLHLIAASQYANPGMTATQYRSGTWGFSYVFIGEIESLGQSNSLSSTQLVNYEQGVPEHEIAHQFNLNGCTNLVDCQNPANPLAGQHDYRPWWEYTAYGPDCPSPYACLMNPGGWPKLKLYVMTNGVHRFCINDVFAGDPNAPCTYFAPSDTALRTRNDPI